MVTAVYCNTWCDLYGNKPKSSIFLNHWQLMFSLLSGFKAFTFAVVAFLCQISGPSNSINISTIFGRSMLKVSRLNNRGLRGLALIGIINQFPFFLQFYPRYDRETPDWEKR